MLKVLVVWACVGVLACRAAKLGQVVGALHGHHPPLGAHHGHHPQPGALHGHHPPPGVHHGHHPQPGALHGHHPPAQLQLPTYNYEPPAQPANLYEVPSVPSGLYETPEVAFVAPPPPAPSGLYQTPDASVPVLVKQSPTTTTEATTTAMMGGMPYNFDWGVNDLESGNQFSQNEVSDGNVVRGQYSVLLPDGRTQIVKYYDEGNGFIVELSYE